MKKREIIFLDFLELFIDRLINQIDDNSLDIIRNSVRDTYTPVIKYKVKYQIINDYKKI